MADTGTLWTGAAISGFGVALGFALNSVSGILKTQGERRGHWLALRADIVRCGNGAKGYLEGGVAAPAGRLPVVSYSISFPALLMAELLSEPDVEALSRFFANAESHNRSLDLAQEALGTHASNFQREVDRAVLKAEKVAAGQPQYLEAIDTVTKHLRRHTGHRLLFWK